MFTRTVTRGMIIMLSRIGSVLILSTVAQDLMQQQSQRTRSENIGAFVPIFSSPSSAALRFCVWWQPHASTVCRWCGDLLGATTCENGSAPVPLSISAYANWLIDRHKHQHPTDFVDKNTVDFSTEQHGHFGNADDCRWIHKYILNQGNAQSNENARKMWD